MNAILLMHFGTNSNTFLQQMCIQIREIDFAKSF